MKFDDCIKCPGNRGIRKGRIVCNFYSEKSYLESGISRSGESKVIDFCPKERFSQALKYEENSLLWRKYNSKKS